MEIERYNDLRVKVADIPWKEMSYEERDAVLERRVAAFREKPPPKREGYVIERIALMSNLWMADIEAQKGNKVRHNACIRAHNEHQAEELRALQLMILTLEFPPFKYKIREQVADSGKVRELVIMDYYPWRILPHAIMQVIEERLHKRLIYDTCACIKGKGLHFGAKRMKRFIRRYDVEYFWKADYKKFYQSIPHELIIGEIRKMYKDEQFLRLMEIEVCSYDSKIDDVLRDERRKRYSHRKI